MGVGDVGWETSKRTSYFGVGEIAISKEKAPRFFPAACLLEHQQREGVWRKTLLVGGNSGLD